MDKQAQIVSLWAFHTGRAYPPQFVGAVAESLRDAWFEESERLRELAEEWFVDFGDEPRERWRFEVRYAEIPRPTREEAPDVA